MTTTTTTDESMALVLELRTIPLFKALGAESLVLVAGIASHVTFESGAVVFDEGDDGDRLYVVSDGEVEIVREGERLATLRAGQCFGEMALIESAPRSAGARSVGRTRLMTIAREDFDDLVNVYPEIARAIAEVLAFRLRDAMLTP